MYLWELVSCRLRVEGWQVRHRLATEGECPSYVVTLRRPGWSCEAAGLTLTDAYAAAARRAHEFAQDSAASNAVRTPHFATRPGVLAAV